MARLGEALPQSGGGTRTAGGPGARATTRPTTASAAGVSKGTFFHHFPDRVSYLVALHRRFHDVLLDEVMSVIGDMSPGKDRLAAAAKTYLDGCLRDRGVKALLLEARRGHLPIADEVTRRNRMTVDVVAADFEALGSRHPRAAARLWMAATAECALMELELGRRDPATRAALSELVE